jgi:hypothetical protein
MMDDGEARSGVEEIKIFRTTLMRSKVPLVDCLKKLADSRGTSSGSEWECLLKSSSPR